MSIWQWILVLLPVIRLGAGLNKIFVQGKDDKRKQFVDTTSLVIAFMATEFLMYKAGVLIVTNGPQ